ncbi:MAG TPA: DUF3347 domain-containing protein [Thermoanaerobaculia bacterium]|nr:DUF3347 domain-containing protein [Thermoanaerobaculia bacterium]
MRKLILILLIAAPLFANTTLFTKYEAVRQSLLKSDLAGAQKNAAALSTEAQKAKKRMVSEFAQGVEKSRDLAAARRNFAALSDEMIKVRNTSSGKRPSVYYCPMVKKSWLQPKGQVGNPYDSMMALCGELKAP